MRSIIKKFFFSMLRLIPRDILRVLLSWHPYFKFIKETSKSQVPITFDHWCQRNLYRHCSEAHWPVHISSMVINPKNVYCGIETSPGYMPGNYIQGVGRIFVGDYTQIGPGVGIISANHNLADTRIHHESYVEIGEYSWIGMNSVILPGVVLGRFTIVAAGSVVTKSFAEGYCVVGGNPASIIKKLDKAECIEYRSEYEYNGFIKAEDFRDHTYRYTNFAKRNAG